MAIRILTNTQKRDSTNKSFTALQIIKVQDIYSLTATIFMKNYSNGKLPEICSDYFTLNNSTHNYPTRHYTEYRIPLCRTCLSSKFIKKTGATIWNDFTRTNNPNMSLPLVKKATTKKILDSYKGLET